MTTTSISIAIVGGGASGLAFAQTVAKEFSSSKVKVEVTLFEKQEYYYNVFGSLRALVDTSYVPKMFIPYDNALPKNGPAKIKLATVSHIDYNSKAVTYSSEGDQESLIYNYDYLVLAAGSSYPSPIKPDPDASTLQKDMETSILETAQHIKGAERILVIGGGAVGCEMAGELKSHYPEKKIMLLDSHAELVSSQDVANIRDPLKEALEKIGVELHLGQKTLTDRLSHHHFGTKTFTMESGMTIESDVQLVCTGMNPNISLMMDHPECLDGNRKFIKVKPTMQVDHPGYENVYVIGDCSNHPTPKMGYWGMQQGQHLGKALAVHIKSGGTKDVKPFAASGTEALIVPLGPNGGRSQLPMFGGIIVGDFFTKMVKSKDLMAGMTWGNLNAKMPNDEVERSCFPF